jgi:serine protease Do
MTTVRRLPILAILILLGGLPLSADRIILKNGHEIIAEVLKSDDRTLVADFGFTVLSLPQTEVDKVLKDSSALDENATATAEETSTDWQLFRTARLQRSTITKNSERYGEAVVMVKTPSGQGSGFIFAPDGHLITNYHVVARETKIKIVVFQKNETGFEQKFYKKVKIIALNPYADLALLKIEEEDRSFRYVYLGDMKRIHTGDQVFAIGNPLGLTRTVSQGIVSTTNRNFEGQLYIQTTTDINPGNSGGPLFNLQGEVIGVTSMGYIYLGGLNFAIPVDVVKRFIENRDAFAYSEDNPNAGYRYLQPGGRIDKGSPPPSKAPATE